MTSTDPVNIAISKSQGMKIDWADGHHSDYSCAYLRDECPCATCTGAHGTPPDKSNYSKTVSDPFPLFKPKVKMLEVEEVGSYAIRINWNDGHNSGIYSHEMLRRICPCAGCRSAAH